MQTVTLSDDTVTQLKRVAASQGRDAEAYADELLSLSLAVLTQNGRRDYKKTHRVMEFSGIAPTGRTAAEINAGRQERNFGITSDHSVSSE